MKRLPGEFCQERNTHNWPAVEQIEEWKNHAIGDFIYALEWENLFYDWSSQSQAATGHFQIIVS